MAKNKSVAQEMISVQTKLWDGLQEGLEQLARGEAVEPDWYLIPDALNLTRPDIEQKVDVVKDALRHRALAGSAPEFAAAQQRVEETAELLHSQRPAIDEQIAELQRQLKAMDEDRATAERNLFRMEQSRSLLRKLAPEHVRRRHARELESIRHLAREISVLKLRKETIEKLLTLNPDRDASYSMGERDGGVPKRVYADTLANRDYDQIVRHGEALQHDGQEAPFLHVKEHPLRKTIEKLVHVPSWQSYLQERRAELAEIEATLPRLEAEYAAAVAEVDSLLDYYLKD